MHQTETKPGLAEAELSPGWVGTRARFPTARFGYPHAAAAPPAPSALRRDVPPQMSRGFFASFAAHLIPSLAVALSYNRVNPGHCDSGRKMQQRRSSPWQPNDCVRDFFSFFFSFKLQSWISNSLRESSKREGNFFFFFSPVGFGTASSRVQNRLSISPVACGSQAGDGTARGHAGAASQGTEGVRGQMLPCRERLCGFSPCWGSLSASGRSLTPQGAREGAPNRCGMGRRRRGTLG